MQEIFFNSHIKIHPDSHLRKLMDKHLQYKRQNGRVIELDGKQLLCKYLVINNA